MKDNSKVVAIVLVAITLIVLIVNFIISKNNTDENKVSIVTNYSDFYTVNSCLYRTITYVSSKDTKSLMLLLNEKYKKNNNVTEDNVLNLFSNVGENSTFVSEKMYYEYLSTSLEKYYVQGYIEDNQIYNDEILQKEDNDTVYFIVYLDSSNNIFSIEPYDGEVFKVGDIDEE